MQSDHDKIKERITELLNSGGVKPYMSQVLAEAIIAFLHEEGLIKKQNKKDK